MLPTDVRNTLTIFVLLVPFVLLEEMKVKASCPVFRSGLHTMLRLIFQVERRRAVILFLFLLFTERKLVNEETFASHTCNVCLGIGYRYLMKTQEVRSQKC